jgi:hypothetical protein
MARRHGRDAASICLGHFPVGSNHNGLSQLDMRLALTPPRRSGSKATFQERPLLAQSGRSQYLTGDSQWDFELECSPKAYRAF